MMWNSSKRSELDSRPGGGSGAQRRTPPPTKGQHGEDNAGIIAGERRPTPAVAGELTPRPITDSLSRGTLRPP